MRGLLLCTLLGLAGLTFTQGNQLTTKVSYLQSLPWNYKWNWIEIPGLKCYNCYYEREVGAEGSPTHCGKDGFSDEAFQVECTAEVGPGPYYCAKWLGHNSDVTKDVIIRNCYGGDETTPGGDLLRPDECYPGEDHYNGTTPVYSGKLCLCEGELCNSGLRAGIQIGLIPLGLLLTFRFIY